MVSFNLRKFLESGGTRTDTTSAIERFRSDIGRGTSTFKAGAGPEGNFKAGVDDGSRARALREIQERARIEAQKKEAQRLADQFAQEQARLRQEQARLKFLKSRRFREKEKRRIMEEEGVSLKKAGKTLAFRLRDSLTATKKNIKNLKINEKILNASQTELKVILTEEIIKQTPNIVTPADIPQNFFRRLLKNINDERRRIRQKGLRGQKVSIKEEAKKDIGAVGSTILSGAIGIVDLVTLPFDKEKRKAITENAGSIGDISKKIGKIIKTEGKNFGTMLKISPLEALAVVGTEVLIFKGTGKALTLTARVTGKVAKTLIPILKSKGTKIIFKGVQINKGGKIVTKIQFKTKGLFKKFGEAVGVTTAKGKLGKTKVIGRIFKKTKKGIKKEVFFKSGEITKAEATKLKKELELLIKKATKGKKAKILTAKQIAKLKKKAKLKIKKIIKLKKKGFLKDKGFKKRSLKLSIEKESKIFVSKIGEDKAIKKAIKRILKSSSKGKSKRALKGLISKKLKKFKIKTKKGKSNLNKIIKKMLKSSEKRRKKLASKVQIEKVRKLFLQRKKIKTSNALKKARKSILKGRKIRFGKVKDILAKAKKKVKAKITIKPTSAKAIRKLLKKSERIRKKGDIEIRIKRVAQQFKAPSNKLKIIKENIKAIKQKSTGKIFLSKDPKKLGKVGKKLRGVTAKNFASFSSILTKKDISLIVGKAITNTKDLVRFEGIIKGIDDITSIGGLSLKQQRVFKQALDKVLGVASSSVTARKILPKLSPTAKASLKKITETTVKTIPAIKQISKVKAKSKVIAKQRQVSKTKTAQQTKQVAKTTTTTKAKLRSSQLFRQRTKQKTKQAQKNRQVSKTKTKLAQKTAQRTRQKQRQKIITKRVTKFKRPFTPRIPVRPIKIGFPIRIKQIKAKPIIKKKRSLIGYNVLVKSKNKFVRVNKKPLSKTQAKDRGAFITDNTITNTYKIIPAGKFNKLGKLTKGEAGNFARTRNKYRGFKLKKKRKIGITNKFIEKKGRPRIDKRGEKQGLTLNKFLKQRGILKSRRKKTSIKRVRKK